MARVMSDAELRRRKKLQGHISQTTSTIGLAGLATLGAGAAIARKPGLIRKIPKYKGLSDEAAKIQGKALGEKAKTAGVISGGIGGVGGYNFAAYTNAESRKKKPAMPVAKSERATELGMDMGYYGEEGHPVKLPTIEVPIEKAWSPVASNYDPEAKRQKRAGVYATGLTAAAGAGTGSGAVLGHRAIKLERKNRTPAQISARSLPKVKAIQDIRHAKAVKSGKGAAILGGAGLAAAAGAAVVHRGRKSGSWDSYGKRDTTSAFGIDHQLDSADPS